MPTPADLPAVDSEILKLGAAAYARIAKGAHREDWLRIGHALNALQTAAMRASGSNNPIGIRYNEYRAYFADRHRLTAMLAGIHPPEQSNAMWLARTWAVVEEWLNKLEPRQRNKLNNPTTIKRHFDRDTKPATEKPETDTVYTKLVRARDEADYYKTERDELLRERLLPPGISMAEFATHLRAQLKPAEIVELIAELQAPLDADDEVPP